MALHTVTNAAPVQTVRGPQQAKTSKPSVVDFVNTKADKVLGPKQKAATLADVKGGDFAKLGTDMKNMSGKQRLEALADLRNNHPTEYAKLMDAMRAGDVKDEQVKLGIGIDRIHLSNYADSDEGKKTIAQLEQQYQDGKIHTQSKDSLDGLGSTVNDIGKPAIGVKSGSTINVAAELMKSPDALAAVLAHEGQHSARAKEGQQETMVSEETAGNMTMSTVWNDLKGTATYKSTGSAEEHSLDTTAGFIDPKFPDDTTAMRAHIKQGYTEFHKNHDK